MDVKITKARLWNLISYDFIKIVATIAAIVMAWVLIFTTCATRATVGETFDLFVFEGVTVNPSEGGDYVSKLKKNGTLSYDVLESSSSTITAAGDYSASYMLTLKMSVQEGDLIVFDGGLKTTKVDEEVETKISSNAQNIVDSALYPLEDFLTAAQNYVDGFLTADGEIDELAIERYFLTKRIKSASNYKKTYRTEASKAEGVKNEIKRISDIYANLNVVKQAVQNAADRGDDIFWRASRSYGEGEAQKAYGLDLGKLNRSFAESGGKKITDLWYCSKESADGEKNETTSEGLVIGVFDYRTYQEDMQYEALAVMANLVREYSDYVR